MKNAAAENLHKIMQQAEKNIDIKAEV